MQIHHLFLFVVLAVVVPFTSAHAQESDNVPVTVTTAVRAAVAKLQPNARDVQVRPSPIQGVSEVMLGMQVLYVSNDGEYAMGGPLLALHDGVNLTEQRLAGLRAKMLSEATDIPMFHYPASEVKHQITVITDIDCPHCRRMHSELPAMQAEGIDIKYVLLPRAGVGSPSYQKSVSAACANDPEASITAAMTGQKPRLANCEHPIDQHLNLARQLKVGSTPSIILENGELVRGYHSAAALLKVIAQRIAHEP